MVIYLSKISTVKCQLFDSPSEIASLHSVDFTWQAMWNCFAPTFVGFHMASISRVNRLIRDPYTIARSIAVCLSRNKVYGEVYRGEAHWRSFDRQPSRLAFRALFLYLSVCLGRQALWQVLVVCQQVRTANVLECEGLFKFIYQFI